MTTRADLRHGDLAPLGGKSPSTEQIDALLQDGAVDLAGHCARDVPGDVPLPRGPVFAAHLARPGGRDVPLFPAGSGHRTLADLPPHRARWSAPRPSAAGRGLSGPGSGSTAPGASGRTGCRPPSARASSGRSAARATAPPRRCRSRSTVRVPGAR
ncbi:hypothetical protein [Kitasatospora sp. NPDC088783]|uniref:hypothetical protein n=1 Tax=Kitasatospora sp. NPDC088783 TaxID=3364077 RepID=UPI003830626C